MCESTSITFSTEEGSNSTEVNRFSIARIEPCLVWMPTTVDPSLTASIAYSTWNNLQHAEETDAIHISGIIH